LLNTAYSIEQQVNFKSQVKDWWMQWAIKNLIIIYPVKQENGKW
jgi:hypothetical protein